MSPRGLTQTPLGEAPTRRRTTTTPDVVVFETASRLPKAARFWALLDTVGLYKQKENVSYIIF